MTSNLKSAVVFGVGFVVGVALGQRVLAFVSGLTAPVNR